MGGRGASSHRATAGGAPSAIPRTLEGFAAAEAQYIANKIAPNLSAADISYIQSQLAQLIANNDLAMRVKREYVEAILNSHFKNQLEIGASQGALLPDYRALTSSALFGHKYDAPNKLLADEFEKYGYLAPRDIVASVINANAEDYGDVIFRFRRDAVMNTTTFTTQDSLGTQDYGFMAGSLRNASIAGLQSDDYSALVSRVNSAQKYLNNPDYWVLEVNGGEYFELQYHGHLSIKDVESVTFGDHKPNNFTSVVSRLKSEGIKVYQVVGGKLIAY